MNGAVSPDKISKFLPSKVINCGTVLFTNSHSSTSSTGILIVCKMVKVFMFKLSMNSLPLTVKNNPVITIKGGRTNSKNLGGIVSVTV